MYWMVYNDKKRYEYYNRFKQTNIDGQIEDVAEMMHGTSFKIKNNALEFQFYPYTDINGISFLNIASEGMRIKKPAYSDTLFLLKDKMEWKFTFLPVKP